MSAPVSGSLRPHAACSRASQEASQRQCPGSFGLGVILPPMTGRWVRHAYIDLSTRAAQVRELADLPALVSALEEGAVRCAFASFSLSLAAVAVTERNSMRPSSAGDRRHLVTDLYRSCIDHHSTSY